MGSDCVCRAPPPDGEGGRAFGRGRARGGSRFLRSEGRAARAHPGPAGRSPSGAGRPSGGRRERVHRIEWLAADLALLESEREVDSLHPRLGLRVERGLARVGAQEARRRDPLLREGRGSRAPGTLLRATGDRRFGFLLLAWADPSADAAPEPAFQREFRVGQWAEAIREHTVDAAQIWIATRGLQPRADEADPSSCASGAASRARSTPSRAVPRCSSAGSSTRAASSATRTSSGSLRSSGGRGSSGSS